MSEDSDSDQATFEKSNATLRRATPIPNSIITSSPKVMQSTIGRSETALSENLVTLSNEHIKATTLSSKSSNLSGPSKGIAGLGLGQSMSKSPNINTNAQSTQGQVITKPIRDSSQTNENGNSSSDSTSNTDTTDSESSSEEEEDAKENSNKKLHNSDETGSNTKGLVSDVPPGKAISNGEASRSQGLTISNNIISRKSPFNPPIVNLPNPESTDGGLVTCEDDVEKDGDGEEFGLENIYKKIIKSTHSPHSQPSPKMSSQVSINIL